jgi:hypothetical protein
MGEERGVHRVLVGKPEGKRPLGRPRRRWEDNMKMDVQEVGGGRGNWKELAQDRDRWRALVSTVKNHQLLKKHSAPWSKYMTQRRSSVTAPKKTAQITVTAVRNFSTL